MGAILTTYIHWDDPPSTFLDPGNDHISLLKSMILSQLLKVGYVMIFPSRIINEVAKGPYKWPKMNG